VIALEPIYNINIFKYLILYFFSNLNIYKNV